MFIALIAFGLVGIVILYGWYAERKDRRRRYWKR
jgi:hypothetical protein